MDTSTSPLHYIYNTLFLVTTIDHRYYYSLACMPMEARDRLQKRVGNRGKLGLLDRLLSSHGG